MNVQETPPTSLTEREELQDEEELEEQEEPSQEASEKKEERRKLYRAKNEKRRLLDRLKAHNEPTRREFVKVKPEIGYIAFIKQGTAIRLGSGRNSRRPRRKLETTMVWHLNQQGISSTTLEMVSWMGKRIRRH